MVRSEISREISQSNNKIHRQYLILLIGCPKHESG
jgi:hypothetical protein